MLKPSVYLRLFGLAAGASLAVAAVAYVRTGGPPPAKAPASRPVPAVQGHEQGHPPADLRAQTGDSGLAPLAEAPEPSSAAPPPPERPTGSISGRLPAAAASPPAAGAPPSPAAGAVQPPAGNAEVPPSARAALVGRPAEPAKGGRLDLNSASVEQLNRLRGAGRIGRRVVAHRPYRAPEDLVRKRVISRTAYARIKDQVRVGRE